METKLDEKTVVELKPVEVPVLPKGVKVGTGLSLYAGRVMPETFGQVIEFSQMMCKGGLAIPKHLRDNPGTCLRVIQQSLAWEMDPWAVASKTYNVNDQIAYEAQLISAVIKKWAPIKERVIPYKFEGAGGELTCSITVHHAETGEEIHYKSPRKADIKPQNSPLWATDPQQQLGYYSIRALARRHFPEILLGVYDREEVLAMRDITPRDQPVDNLLEDEPAVVHTGEILPPQESKSPSVDNSASVTAEAGASPAPSQGEAPAPLTPKGIADNLILSIEGFTSKVMLEEWQHDNAKTINEELPPEEAKRVRKALADRHFDLEEL